MSALRPSDKRNFQPVGRPFEALAVASALSYFCVIAIMGRGWRMSRIMEGGKLQNQPRDTLEQPANDLLREGERELYSSSRMSA